MAVQNSPNVVPDNDGDLAFLEEKLEKPKNKVTTELSKHIQKVWARNQRDFKPIRREMIKLLRRCRGEYETKKLSDIRALKGSEIFIRSSEAKARAAESWIKDIYTGVDMPWDIEPTAKPDLPDETVQQITESVKAEALQIEAQMKAAGLPIEPQKVATLINEYYKEKLDEAKEEMYAEAKERADRASNLIKDQNQEGNWADAFKDFLYYFVRLKFGVIKGPILTKRKVERWFPDEATGGYVLKSTDELAHDVYCVSPFNFYPQKGIKDINDGDCIEIHELSRQSISKLIGVPSYNEDEIRAVLREHESGKLKEKWLTIDDEEEVKRAETDKDKALNSKPATRDAQSEENRLIYAMEFYGTVSGKMLIDWGYEEPLDPHMQYKVNCWKIGDHVIKAVLNPDNLNRKPYHVSSWAKNPAWIIGEGLVEFAGPIEDAMNSLARAIVNNAAIASGPMCEIDTNRVDTTLPIYPWRQIESTSKQMKSEGPAVNYYQPQMHSQELIGAWQFFSKVLDEMTVPAYAQGASQSGVTAGTATVFTQLLAAASRSIKAVVANIDDDIIAPYIKMCYDNNMRFSDDQQIKGDARIVAKGITELLAKEQQAQRKVEYLQIVANPAYMQILGRKNVASVLAQIAKANDIELPDMGQLDGSKTAELQLEQMLMAQAGVDPMQENGQVAAGGGAPSKPQGTNPDGSKAGVNNG